MRNKIIALVRKDLLIESSYKLSFIFNVFSVLSAVLIYFFIDKLFGRRMTPHLEEFGVNYFSYVLLGMAFFSYIGVGIGAFAARIRAEQLQGTLESLLVTPTHSAVILLGMGLWNLIFATVDVVIYIVCGIFVFNIDFSGLNILSTAVILCLAVVSFSSLGILSASFVIVLKKGNPVAWVINTLEGLLGGVYFPVAVLPAALQIAARFLPITYAIRGLQLAVYRGYSLGQLKTEWGFLLLFCLILVPASLYSFTFALKKARFQGSLLQY